jgi:hypothetical protein
MSRELSERAQSVLARALLEEQARAPGAAQRARLKRGLLQGVALGAATSAAVNAQAHAAGTTSAVSKGFALLPFAKGIAVGLALSGTLAGGALWLGKPATTTPPALPPAATSRAISAAKLDSPRVPTTNAALPPDAPAPSTLVSQPAFVEPPTPRARASEPNSAPSGVPALGAELQLMNAAQTALRDGRASEALRLLARYDLEFPSGQLESERLAAEVVAACQLGLRDRARRAADLLLARDSSRVLTDRVKHSCAF